MSVMSRRAANAVINAPDGDAFKTFLSRTQEMSSRIVWAGLKPALDCLKKEESKDEDDKIRVAAAHIYNALLEWVNPDSCATQADYRRATDQALEYLNWLRYTAKGNKKSKEDAHEHSGSGGFQNVAWGWQPSQDGTHVEHPGLKLDKFSVADNQEQQKKVLSDICNTKVDSKLFDFAFAGRKRMLDALCAAQWVCTTTAPLTLHLARNAALENAGICLHPIYGFVYLPGSGLKGMARAYAESVWLPSLEKEKQESGKNRIIEVFGNKRGEKNCDAIQTGCVVFHDAWPRTLPNLHVDIVNNHHRKYYQGTGDDMPPGDWENPVPVYFLAISAETDFSFAVSKLWAAVDDKRIEDAQIWLAGALNSIGAGAKTAAGYGRFRVVDEKDKEIQITTKKIWTGALNCGDRTRWFEEPVTVRFVSPAFLGGSSHNLDNPVLRAASLKGQLRFWWRAMHGDWNVGRLRQEEGRIFGSLATGNGVRIHVSKERCFRLAAGSPMGSVNDPIPYLGYGPIQYVKEQKQAETIYDAIGVRSNHTINLIHTDRGALGECVRALWLMCALGGLGSRSRRGWGSLELTCKVLDLPDLFDCETSQELERRLLKGLDMICPSKNRHPMEELQWTAIGSDSVFIVSRNPVKSSSDKMKMWPSAEALGQIGECLKKFRTDNRIADGQLVREGVAMKQFQHLPKRAAFGLPFAQEMKDPEVRVDFVPLLDGFDKETSKGRRASPLFFKILPIGTSDDRKYVWVVAYLPSQFLPVGAKVGAYVGKAEKVTGKLLEGPAADGTVAPGEESAVTTFVEGLRGSQTAEDPLAVSHVGPIKDFGAGALPEAEFEIVEKIDAKRARAKNKDSGEEVVFDKGVKNKKEGSTFTAQLIGERWTVK